MKRKYQIAAVSVAVVAVTIGSVADSQERSNRHAAQTAKSEPERVTAPRSVGAERALARNEGGDDTAKRLEAARAYLAESESAPTKLAAAERHLESVLRRDPANADALMLAGQMEMQKEQWAAAAAYYRKATSAAPRNPAAYLGLGDALSRLGDDEGAAEAFAGFRAASGREPLEE